MDRITSLLKFRPWHLLAAALSTSLIVIGCGGGGDSVGTGGTGASALSFSTGRIAGFGSIIVNGVRFDDSSASVSDDDGAGHVRGDLKLGMEVEVHGGQVSTDAATGTSTASATSIQFGSAIKGPVASVDLTAQTLTVLGQTVKVDLATVFEGFPNGLASVQVADQVDVHAFFDKVSGAYQATRIELKTGLTEFKLRGVISALDTTTKTFAIGGATISYAGIADAQLPSLSIGLLVRVKLQTAQQATNWVATKVTSVTRHIDDRTETEVEGIVTDFVSLASFKVNGVTVDASGAGVVFKNGVGADVIAGHRVEVEGTMLAGVLVARKVELRSSDGHDVETELHGAVESVDAAAKTFVLRGLTISYDDTTRFDGGTAAAILVGVRIEVRGTLSASGTQIVASRIKFEN